MLVSRFAVALAVLSFAGSALALPFNDRGGPVPVGQNGGEDSLQQILDDITLANPIDVIGDQSDAAIFESIHEDAIATFVVEVAGFAPYNQFGIYSYDDPSKRIAIFDGPDGSGDAATVTFTAGMVSVDGGDAVDGFGTEFGFYIHTRDGDVFFTEDELNGGAAQSLVFFGDEDDEATVMNIGGDLVYLDDETALIAFEDLSLGESDFDYQDLVVLVSGIQAVAPGPRPAAAMPEPSGRLVFAMGMLVTTIALRRGAWEK